MNYTEYKLRLLKEFLYDYDKYLIDKLQIHWAHNEKGYYTNVWFEYNNLKGKSTIFWKQSIDKLYWFNVLYQVLMFIKRGELENE